MTVSLYRGGVSRKNPFRCMALGFTESTFTLMGCPKSDPLD